MFGTLQTCRAFAALIVVLFHLSGTIALTKYFGTGWITRPFAFGHAGVDFFFVLSGFIIVHVHRRDFGQPSRLLVYLKKRLIRIYPVYWIVIFGVCLAALPFASLRETLPTDAGVFLRSLLLLPQDSQVVGGTGAPVLIVAWSLQYEVLFYAMVAVFVVSRLAGAALLAAFAMLYVFRPFGSAFPFDFLQRDWILLFLIGAVVAMVNRGTVRVRWPLIWAGLGFALFIGNGLREVFDPAQQPGAGSHLVYGLASALMILGLVRAEASGLANALKPRWAMLIGNASYVLYLVHFPLISVVCKVTVALGFSGVSGAITTFVIGLITSVVASILFHLYVEKPFLRYIGTKLLGERKVAESVEGNREG